MYVDWEYYKIFYYVAKYQNFTKAARVLGNNQPNITHSMNRLESQLNCVLFIRSNRGVTLTPEGEMLYSRIASAAVQIQDAEEELSASATLDLGIICMWSTETALNIYLSKKLRDFHTEYPGIRLRISNHSTPQAVQAVKNGEVDFAIVSTPAEIESGLKMVELKPFYEVLVGGRTFTALASQSLTLKELRSYPLISLSDESVTRSLYRQFFLDHGAVLKPDTEAATTDQMLSLVNSELGLAFVPEPMAREPLQRGEIVQLHLQEIIPSRSICLVYDHHRPLNTAARKFQQLLTKTGARSAEHKKSRPSGCYCTAASLTGSAKGFPRTGEAFCSDSFQPKGAAAPMMCNSPFFVISGCSASAPVAPPAVPASGCGRSPGSPAGWRSGLFRCPGSLPVPP